MTPSVLAFAFSIVASTGAPASTPVHVSSKAPITRATLSAGAEIPPVQPLAPHQRWMIDTPEKRPAALPVLYATFGALQMADAYSTRRAVSAGAVEANPLMKDAAKRSGTLYAVKAASTAASIYLAEKMWKKNRKGTVIMMAVINGVTAAVVARNMKNAR